MLKKQMASVCFALGLCGCQSVTILPEPGSKIETEPTYQETKTFYFWGLKGEHRVDVKQVCGDKKPVQMQTQLTFLNGLLGGLTLGIYAPHTVKVWCEAPKA